MIFFAEWIENWNLQNLRSWNGQEWEKIFFSRNIPGCAVALLLGNVFYAWQCGRLGNKEGRTDVTAQPYGINTTGVYITLYAIQLQALFAGASKFFPSDPTDTAAVEAAAYNAADHAWKISVACNFILGIFEWLVFWWDWFRNLTFGSWEKIDMCFDFGKLLVAVFLGSLCPVLS